MLPRAARISADHVGRRPVVSLTCAPFRTGSQCRRVCGPAPPQRPQALAPLQARFADVGAAHQQRNASTATPAAGAGTAQESGHASSSSGARPLRSRLRAAAQASAALVALTYAAYGASSNDWALAGPIRGARYWLRFGPTVAKYAWLFYTKGDNATDQEWDALHEFGAAAAQRVIVDLRGLYVKAGQFGSARPDVLPEAYIKRFRALQNQLPPALGAAEIEDIVKELQREAQASNANHAGDGAIAPRIARISGDCLGAASIGQAHRCELEIPGKAGRDGSYCCKLQYPDAKLLFYVDLACIRTVVGLLVPEMSNIMQELEKQFLCEFDYVAEKDNLERMRRNMGVRRGDLVEAEAGAKMARTPFPYDQKFFTPALCAIPEPVPALCSEKLLVMRFLRGVKVEEGLIATLGGKQQGMADIARRLLGETGDDDDSAQAQGGVARGKTGGQQTSGTAGETSASGAVSRSCSTASDAAVSLASRLIDLLPFVLYIRRLAQQLSLFFLGLGGGDGGASIGGGPSILGAACGDSGGGGGNYANTATLQGVRRVHLRARATIDSLFGVHGEQIFYHGLFQGDPHPGNFLLLDQEDGPQSAQPSAVVKDRLGLIDFGQCKALTLQQRLSLARLVLAVADDDSGEIVRVLREEYKIGGGGGGKPTEIGADNSAASDWFLEKIGRFAFGELNSKLTDGRNLRDFSKALAEGYQNQVIPGELYMPMRTSIILRGLGLLLNCYVSPAEAWRPMAEACLRERV